MLKPENIVHYSAPSESYIAAVDQKSRIVNHLSSTLGIVPPETRNVTRRELLSEVRPHVAIIGGAVAGAQLASEFAGTGIAVSVFEKNADPFGKILKGLPFWHENQRKRETETIIKQLSHELVTLVPNTEVGGKDFPLEKLYKEGFSAVVMANGAWMDRQHPKSSEFEGMGNFEYQNPFIMRLNDHWAKGKPWEDFELLGEEKTANKPMVVGGGLASLDVMKAVMLIRVYQRLYELKDTFGIDMSQIDIQEAAHSPKIGVKGLLEKTGITFEELGIEKGVLVYRGSKEKLGLNWKMPPQIVDKQADLYYFDILEGQELDSVISDSGKSIHKVRLVPSQPLNGEYQDIEVSSVYSSIGSIPAPFYFEGKIYDIGGAFSGEITAFPMLLSMVGNRVSGQGNIKASRDDARLKAPVIITSVKGKKDLFNHKKAIAFGDKMRLEAGYDDDIVKWIVKNGQLSDYLLSRWWLKDEKTLI